MRRRHPGPPNGTTRRQPRGASRWWGRRRRCAAGPAARGSGFRRAPVTARRTRRTGLAGRSRTDYGASPELPGTARMTPSPMMPRPWPGPGTLTRCQGRRSRWARRRSRTPPPAPRPSRPRSLPSRPSPRKRLPRKRALRRPPPRRPSSPQETVPQETVPQAVFPQAVFPQAVVPQAAAPPAAPAVPAASPLAAGDLPRRQARPLRPEAPLLRPEAPVPPRGAALHSGMQPAAPPRPPVAPRPPVPPRPPLAQPGQGQWPATAPRSQSVDPRDWRRRFDRPAGLDEQARYGRPATGDLQSDERHGQPAPRPGYQGYQGYQALQGYQAQRDYRDPPGQPPGPSAGEWQPAPRRPRQRQEWEEPRWEDEAVPAFPARRPARGHRVWQVARVTVPVGVILAVGAGALVMLTGKTHAVLASSGNQSKATIGAASTPATAGARRRACRCRPARPAGVPRLPGQAGQRVRPLHRLSRRCPGSGGQRRWPCRHLAAGQRRRLVAGDRRDRRHPGAFRHRLDQRDARAGGLARGRGRRPGQLRQPRHRPGARRLHLRRRPRLAGGHRQRGLLRARVPGQRRGEQRQRLRRGRLAAAAWQAGRRDVVVTGPEELDTRRRHHHDHAEPAPAAA